MMIEALKKPQSDTDLLNLHLALVEEMNREGLVVERDDEFGGLGRDYFGYNIDDIRKGVDLGFL